MTPKTEPSTLHPTMQATSKSAFLDNHGDME